MKKLLVRGLKFSSPLLIILMVIATVDPYCYFEFNNIIPAERKKDISRKLNPALWSIIQYSHNPGKNILIGDSRMGNMRTEVVKEISGKDFYMFTFGGGNLREILSTYKYITSTAKIESLYIGVNLELYNKTNNRDRVSGAISILKNPLLYIINLNVWQATYKILTSYFSGEGNSIGRPEVSRDKFWIHQVKVTGQRNLANYVYPDNYKKELVEIGEYCKKEKIDFKFIVFPTHTDIQRLFDKYQLLEENNQFLKDLSEITKVYDLNFPNEITRNQELFADPYHINRDLFCKRYIPLLLNSNANPSDSIVRVYNQMSNIQYTTFTD